MSQEQIVNKNGIFCELKLFLLFKNVLTVLASNLDQKLQYAKAVKANS